MSGLAQALRRARASAIVAVAVAAGPPAGEALAAPTQADCDGRASFTAPVAVPDGSIEIEDLFESFYTLRGEPYDDAAFDGRSDYQAFIVNDIPAGGLFTGAEVPKTEEQQEIWGGTVGAQFDPGYHAACDTFANNNDHALDVNADAIGFAILTYGYSTAPVNGVRGQRVPGNFRIPAPAGSEGTFVP